MYSCSCSILLSCMSQCTHQKTQPPPQRTSRLDCPMKNSKFPTLDFQCLNLYHNKSLAQTQYCHGQRCLCRSLNNRLHSSLILSAISQEMRSSLHFRCRTLSMTLLLRYTPPILCKALTHRHSS